MSSKILIIDDEESIRINFEAFLKEEGHNVLIAEDYISAMEIFSGLSLDLVIADILLKGHSGIDILREVKKEDPRCPVIIITGRPNVESSTEAVRLGAFDYLIKPVRKVALLKAVKQALYQKGLEEEKERYRSNLEAIFRSLKSAIISVDHEMRVIEANEAIQRICGFSSNEIIGNELTSVRNPCSRTCQSVLKEALEKNEAIKEFRIECKHDSHPGQTVILNCSPLLDQRNKSMGAILVVRDITRLAHLERELRERHKYHNIIGKSKEMQGIFRLIEDLSDVDTTVLITGESGTGKELIGKALHYSGIRSEKLLVSVNCSALAENLLESELFGHVKGAFTGAVKDKIGRFQLADGGTIFLDEIGDMSPRIQQRLMRVIQEKEFERVGDSYPIKVDARVIAATNRDLKIMIRQGEFRQDLYYRLKVVEIQLPPLRERSEDIPLLIDHFRHNLKRKFNKDIHGVSDDLLDTLMRYSWPGNIRELEHALEHAFILCHEQCLSLDHLPSEIRDFSHINTPTAIHGLADESQRILQVLNNTDWNKAKAARILGISRPTLYCKIEEYHLTRQIR